MLKEWGEKLIGSLPPAFLVLLSLNLVFLGMVLWFLNAQLDIRAVLLGKIIDKCLVK